MYGALFVGQLWVKEELRHQGLGTKLMLKAEDLAKESNCSFIAVNTFDWPGPFHFVFIRRLDFMLNSKDMGLTIIQCFIF